VGKNGGEKSWDSALIQNDFFGTGRVHNVCQVSVCVAFAFQGRKLRTVAVQGENWSLITSWNQNGDKSLSTNQSLWCIICLES